MNKNKNVISTYKHNTIYNGFHGFKIALSKTLNIYIHTHTQKKTQKQRREIHTCNSVDGRCGGKMPDNPNLCIYWTKGPIRELEVARGQEKHFQKTLC